MVAAAYARIASELRGKITSRDIKPGGHLPTELELRGRYGASRNTILDAIRLLKDEGLVETRPGQGWFATVRIVPFVNCVEWEDGTAERQATALGRNPQAKPPAVAREPAPREMAARLSVPVGTEMVVRRQEWFLDDLPWKLQTVWCPIERAQQAPRLLVAADIAEGVGGYLYDALQRRPANDTYLVLPRKGAVEENRFFGFEDNAPWVIELTRTAHMATDDGPRPLYAAVGVYAGDRNRFEVSRTAPSWS
jgi:GntR family transcriptional regulator